MERIIILVSILIFKASFQGRLITLSRFLRLTVKTLCPGFLVSIINRAVSILIMFKRILEALRFIIFGLDLEKVEVEARDIWGSFDLPNSKIVIRLNFDE